MEKDLKWRLCGHHVSLFRVQSLEQYLEQGVGGHHIRLGIVQGLELGLVQGLKQESKKRSVLEAAM